MKLLYFNLTTDKKNSALGFSVNWVNEISKSYEEVFLITLNGNKKDLNSNIVFHKLYGKYSLRVIGLIKFYYYLFKIIFTNRIDHCFCHMNPLFLTLTMGILNFFSVKTILWYTHPSITLKLKIASLLSDRIVTASEKSFPLNSNKLIVVGHAIDTSLFKRIELKKKYISCVGRISRVKNIDILIVAFSKIKNEGKKLLIVGDTLTKKDQIYKLELLRLIKKLKIEKFVEINESVKRNDLYKIYNSSIVHVNLTSEGFLDKVSIESMSSGTICLSSNSGYKDIYGEYSNQLIFKYRDEIDLSKKIKSIINMTEENRVFVEKYLMKKTNMIHSIKSIGNRIQKVYLSI